MPQLRPVVCPVNWCPGICPDSSINVSLIFGIKVINKPKIWTKYGAEEEL